ncbi:hypothetical protein ACFO5R_02610 [Halosolutus amylolyticus]|uniref:Uncharacterized protein n=1 Tax=Halosolutus amylolyticus TaxID=2932267 RepID=A0ABD5PK81_9EURY|nr:hypothetical protein [Halosolutus amylolyticus]
MSEAEADKIERFTSRVEEEAGHEIWVDQELGDDLGWFMVETQIELQGRSFDAEVDFNLSESEVSLLYAEITIDPSDEEEETVLDEEAERIDWGDDYVLYELYPTESKVKEVVDELRAVHSEIFC